MEICKCGGRTRACQQNLVECVECKDCGRRFFRSADDMALARESHGVDPNPLMSDDPSWAT